MRFGFCLGLSVPVWVIRLEEEVAAIRPVPLR